MADAMHVIEGDSPVKGDLMFWSIVGHEGFSRASAYELTVLSEKKTISAADILGYAFDVQISFFDEGKSKHKRHFQGHAVRFLCLRQVGRYFEYRISLRSWFWLLTKRWNSRIHQDKKVLEVFDATVNDSPISKLNKVRKGHVTEPHTVRHYCVQFQESDHDFLSRLLEEEGIYYWFDTHDAPGTMHLSDSSVSAHDPLPVEAALEYRSSARQDDARFNEIDEWVAGRRFESGKYVSQDSQYVTIRKKLSASNPVPDDHELADLEVFEFPGNYLKNEDVDIPDSDVENTGKVRGKEIVAARERHWALTQWPDVAVGKSFRYKGDPDSARNGEYIIAGCTLVVSHPGYEGIGDAQAARSQRAALQAALANDNFNAGTVDVLQDLIDSTHGLREGARGTRRFLISCLPKKVMYKPARITPRVVMPGPQSAIVVGPKGEELHVDKHGRVKVHFHWDRYDKSDENSTCWVRVSQPWAGKEWGGYFAPRIGQEVIVDFINGDPDRPLIMGRVYNDDQPIPYQSPTQSGFKTRSTPKGKSSNYNEIMFEDKKGEENLNIHAERNMSRSVEVDDSTSVGRDQSVSVDRDQTTTVKRNRSVTVTEGDETYTVNKGKRTTKIAKDETKEVGVNKKTTVSTGNHELTVELGDKKSDVKKNQTTKVGEKYTLDSKNADIIVANQLVIQTKGERKELTQAKQTIVANEVELAAAGGNIDIIASGDINLVAKSIHNSLLQDKKEGIAGTSSSFEFGTSLTTSISASVENKLSATATNEIGFSSKNELAIAIENQIAIGIENTGAMKLKATLFDIERTTMKSIQPGSVAPTGEASGSLKILAGVMSALSNLGGIVGGVFGITQVFEAVDEEKERIKDEEQRKSDALAKLAALREEAAQAGMTGLADKLGALHRTVADRKVDDSTLQGLKKAAGITVGAVAGAAAGAPGAVVGGIVGGVIGGSKPSGNTES